MVSLHQSMKKDRYVIIEKQLTSDPYNKRGEMGKIIAETKDGDYVIQFTDKTLGLYEADTFHKTNIKR